MIRSLPDMPLWQSRRVGLDAIGGVIGKRLFKILGCLLWVETASMRGIIIIPLV